MPFVVALLFFTLGLAQAPAPPSEERIRTEAARWLAGPLSHIPEETKIRLVRQVHKKPGSTRGLTHEVFRDKLYLEVLLNSGPDEEHPPGTAAPVIDRMKVVGALTDSRLIPELVEYAGTLGNVPGIHGIKLLLIELPANSFIQLYAPLGLINGVRSGRNTLQALLDGSVFYVNNEIVRVKLP